MFKSQTGICLPEDAEKITRRIFLESGVSLTAYMSMSQLLPNVAAAAPSFPLQRRLIWINLSGGWDILEATDPKPRSTSGITIAYDWSEAHELSGSTDGTRIGRWLPKIAGIGEDVVVVRGLAMGTTAHDAGNIYMDTGVLSNAGRVNAASIPAIVASESTATIPIIQLNGGNEALTDRGLLNPVSVVRAQNLQLYSSMYPANAKEKSLRLRMLDYVQESITRAQGSSGVNDRLSDISNAESKIRDQINSDVGSKLSTNASDLAAYTTGAPQGFNAQMANNFALASKLIRNDIISCVNLGVGGFDTHANQDTRMQPIMVSLDHCISVLVEQLREANALDNTLIVLYSDFGRTPKINNTSGRDHWPVGGAMLIGGGIQGGRAVGGTDNNLLAENTNLTSGEVSSSGSQINPTHLCGSVLQLCLGSGYMQYRSYLQNIDALTLLKS
jgi:hypothetical protein